MNQLTWFLAMATGLLLASCNTSANHEVGQSNQKSKRELKADIAFMEDSIKSLSVEVQASARGTLSRQELINRLLLFYRAYPSDAYAAECLFKVQMIYSGLNAHEKSVAYGDTLLMKFPSYSNKYLVIESNIAALDIFISPRDTANIRHYYNMLLNDPTYPKSKKGEIQKRLKHLDLNIFDFSVLNEKLKTKK